MKPQHGATFAVVSYLVQHSALATPVEKGELMGPLLKTTTHGGLTFRINQVPNQKFHGARSGSGPMAIARAYSKHGAAIPKNLLSYMERLLEEQGLLQGPKNGDDPSGGSPQGDVAAVPRMFDSEYLCPVQIGTPPQTLNLDFDTGSSDFWVFSSETPSNLVSGQAVYDIPHSSTAKLLAGESWAIKYGDGSSSGGNVYVDTVSVGGITVESQAIESATSVSHGFTERPDTDGLVGLAFNPLNTVRPTKQNTFFDNVMWDLTTPLFTANLRASGPGNYNFGFIDPNEFSGQITYLPVNTSTGFWQVVSQGLKIGDSSTIMEVPHDAIIDTGTTLLLVPENIAAAYYAQVPGAVNAVQTSGGYVFPCSATLPNYTAVMEPYEAVIPGRFLNFAPVDGGTSGAAATCFGGIQVVPAGFPFAIYGDVFLKSQFVVFHGGDTQIGLATKPL